MAPDRPRILIVGNEGGTHVGASLQRAAMKLGISIAFQDVACAYEATSWLARLKWRLLRQPAGLAAFSSEVVRLCEKLRPEVLLCAGLPPIQRAELEGIGRLGVRTACWLTDDPWSPASRSSWGLDSLRAYHVLFTPRHSNLGQLAAIARRAEWLPFGFDETLCFPERGEPSPAIELLFVGGADRDRVRWMRDIIAAGIKPTLYGGYWDRDAVTRRYAGGIADPATVRRATSAAKACLCLVRRSNRDGHVMRSYEIPACAGVPLMEDTADHRRLFGPDALYFHDRADVVPQIERLMTDMPLRKKLAEDAAARVRSGGNTYRDRLATILAVCDRL